MKRHILYSLYIAGRETGTRPLYVANQIIGLSFNIV